MPTRVLLLRHAETSDPRVFHGAESDVGLSERGGCQAESIAAYLAGERPEVLICSGMLRARQTAATISRVCGLPIQVEPALHERQVGALSGTPAGMSEGPWPETIRRWMEGQTDYSTPGAESFDALQERILPVWERLTTAHAGRTLAIVAHGIVCRVLILSLVPGYSIADWKRLGMIRNVAVHEFVRPQPEACWQLLKLDHLPPGVEDSRNHPGRPERGLAPDGPRQVW